MNILNICSVVNAIGTIRLALSDILCFNILQISSKVTSPHKKSKSNWSDCFESLQLVRGQMFQLRFFSDINTDARFGFYCCARYHASFCIRRLIRFACLPAHASLLSVFLRSKSMSLLQCGLACSERVITGFFCFRLETCCERAITFVPITHVCLSVLKILWIWISNVN